MSEKIKLVKKAFGNYWSNGKENLFKCPKCNHHKKKLSVNIEKGVFKCWICDYSGTKISQLFKRYAPRYHFEYQKLEGEINLNKYEDIFQDIVVRNTPAVELPRNFQTLTGHKTSLMSKPLEYLYSRGITDEDILSWKIGFCNFGEYRERIIIPSFDSAGELNFFIARSYVDDWMKYKNPKISKDIIFNDLNIDWTSDVILVEGVFDAIKCRNSIPILGSSLREGSLLFQKICEFKPDIYLALDQDAKEKELFLAKKLKEYDIRVKKIKIDPFSDIGEMPKDIVIERKQNAELVSEMDYLEYKLNF